MVGYLAVHVKSFVGQKGGSSELPQTLVSQASRIFLYFHDLKCYNSWVLNISAQPSLLFVFCTTKTDFSNRTLCEWYC